jgi:hypothetical protein
VRITDEIETIYLMPGERFVVSLVVGYVEDDSDLRTLIAEYGDEENPDPRLAAVSAAVNLVTGEGRDGTQWYVWDRETKTGTFVEQGDVEREPRLYVGE